MTIRTAGAAEGDSVRFVRLPFVAAWAAALIGSLLAFLNFHEYPLAQSEVAVLIAIFLSVALLVGIVHASGGRAIPLMDAALAYVAIDLNFDPPYPLIGALFAALLCLIARRSIAPIAAVVFFFVIGGQLLSAARKPEPQKAVLSQKDTTDAPAIVHVVLDEHIGIEGMDMRDPDMRRTADSLRKTYVGLGFTLYGGAHSRHFRTTNSLPEIFNFGRSRLGGESRRNREGVLTENRYFDDLAGKGYSINVLQSDFLDYCGHKAVISCTEYRRSDLAPLAQLDLSLADKSRIIGAGFVSLSGGLTVVSYLYDHLAVRARKIGLMLPYASVDTVRLTSTLAAMNVAGDFTKMLRKVKPGHVYFAHFLFPHYPHVARADCSAKPLAMWGYRREGGNIASRNRAYEAQLQCSARLVGGFLEALSTSPAGRSAIVIVHGDHGSRITRVDPKVDTINNVSWDDMIVSYSALFSIRMPASEGRYEPRVAAISGLLKQFVGNDLRSPPSVSRQIPGTNQIYLEDREWRPIRTHPLSPPHATGFNRILAKRS